MRFGQGSRARALRVLDSRCVCVRIHPGSRTHARTLPLLLLLLPVLVPVLLLPVLLQIIGRPRLTHARQQEKQSRRKPQPCSRSSSLRVA